MERHNRPASPASRHIARSTIPASRHFSTREGGACSSRNFATESSKMTMSSSLRKSARSIFKTGIAVLPERLLPPAHWGDRIAEGWSLSSLIVCLCSCCRRSAACGSREPFGQPKRELICDGSEWDKVNQLRRLRSRSHATDAGDRGGAGHHRRRRPRDQGRHSAAAADHFRKIGSAGPRGNAKGGGGRRLSLLHPPNPAPSAITSSPSSA